MVNAGRETSMAKHDFSISGFETIANAVAAENCRYGIHFMPCARATGRDWRRVWLTAEDQALTAKDQALTAEDQALTAKERQRAAQCGSHDIGHKDFGVLLSVLINYL